MRTVRSISFRFWLLAASTLAAGFLLVSPGGAPKREAVAANHVIHTQAHPFDPDWLEVLWVLRRKCTGCHRAGGDRQDFTSYEALMEAGHEDEMPAIVPFKPDDSMFWDQVQWNAQAAVDSDLADSPAMPTERSEWLTAGQLATVYRWIKNGALQYRLPDHCESRPLLETDFPSAKECTSCHPKQYAEWSRSMHHYAQHSPVFMAFNLTLIERTGGTIGTFCTRCHTPVGTSLGENGSRRNTHRSRLSMEGVTCIACHRRKDGRYKSNGRIAIQPGSLLETCIYGPFDAAPTTVPTHASEKFPYTKSSQFCGECHDVTSPQGVRLEEAFSEWNNSPAAKARITCQHCHMGPVQGVPIPDDHRPLGPAATVPGVPASSLPMRRLVDHTFSGPDYSLLPDTEFPNKLDWMYEVDYRDPSRLTPYQQRTLLQLRISNREHLRIAAAKRLELLRNAAFIRVAHAPTAAPGEKLHVKVELVNKVSGHSLPTGFTGERQMWLQVEVRDPNGNVVFASGDLDSNQDLRDDHSHDVLTGHAKHDRHLVNLQNKFIALFNKGSERSVVLSVNRFVGPINVVRPADGIVASFGRPNGFRIAKGSLPPLRSRHKSYPVRLSECGGPHSIIVRLNFRHLPPTLLDHVGVPHLKHLLEVVVIDEYRGLIHVGGAGS